MRHDRFVLLDLGRHLEAEMSAEALHTEITHAMRLLAPATLSAVVEAEVSQRATVMPRMSDVFPALTPVMALSSAVSGTIAEARSPSAPWLD